MEKNIVTALIVTRSIPLGEGLEALLRAISQVNEVEVTRSMEKALHKIATNRPGIIFLDAALVRNDTQAAMENIASSSPETIRILLVDNVQDVKWMPKYAEAILIKGVSPSAVVTIVTNLLSTKGVENECDDSDR